MQRGCSCEFLCFTFNTYSNIQWGSGIQPFEIQKNLKSRLFEGWISNGLVFKWLGFSFSYSPNHSKSRRFWPDYKWFLTKWLPIVQISNDWSLWSHSKSRLFATQPLLDHSNSRPNPYFRSPLNLFRVSYIESLLQLIWVLSVKHSTSNPASVA